MWEVWFQKCSYSWIIAVFPLILSIFFSIALSCSRPPSVLNAQVWYDSASGISNVTYICNPGYTLFGSPHRICRANGDWEGVAPYCCMYFNIHMTSSDQKTVRVFLKTLQKRLTCKRDLLQARIVLSVNSELPTNKRLIKSLPWCLLSQTLKVLAKIIQIWEGKFPRSCFSQDY